MRPLLSALVAGLLLVAAVTWLRGPRGARPIKRRELLMDTLVTMTVFPRPGVDTEAAAEAAFARMRAVEQLFSSYQGSTPLARLNRDGRLPRAELTEEFVRVLAGAGALHRETGGRYDPGLGRLLVLWGFGPGGEPGRVPEPAALAEARRRSGYDALSLEDPEPTLARGAQLDLGGYAKGWAVDEAVRLLKEKGLAALVDAGGDMACTGPKPDGSPWRIGVRDPRKEGALLGVVPLNTGAVATSGDYERFFELEGKRYHHLLDPATGRPARRHIQASVRARTCAEADAWATALFVAAPEAAPELAKGAGVAAMLVAPDLSRRALGGFSMEPPP